MMRRWFWISLASALIISAITSERPLISRAFAQADTAAKYVPMMPLFEKDMAWPKPLPKNYYIGQVSGMSVDSNDNVWIANRPRGEKSSNPAGEARRNELWAKHEGTAAPAVIELDNGGTFIQAWGGTDWVPQPAPGRKVPSDYKWFNDEHGILADKNGHVWVSGHTAGGGNDPPTDLTWGQDTHLLEFTTDGKFLMMIGHPNHWGGSNDKLDVGNSTTMAIDLGANELYVGDGEGNHRVVVFDSNTGVYKRHWGAYGNVPDENLDRHPVVKVDPDAAPAQQFGNRGVHCILIGNDGLVYMCDRANWRIQVFHKDGTFVKETYIATGTPGLGSVWSMGFSPDQKYIYVGDGGNQKIWFLRRDRMEIVGSYGDKNNPAMVVGSPHSMAVDSKGNMYIGGQNPSVNPARYLLKGYGPSNLSW